MLHSRLVVLRDCGHVPQEEKSDIVLKSLLNFVDDKKGRIDEKDDEIRFATT